MKLIQRVARKPRFAVSPRTIALLFIGLLAGLLPTSALASEGEGVVLKFSGTQQNWLFATLGLGIAALLYGLIYLRNWVMKESAGSPEMQSVGLAIREGALAYLVKQIKTMAPLIVILMIGLFLLYMRLGSLTAGLVSFCFLAGVSGSYIAGYSGMLMAVAGNMRTANAALTSYKKSLEVAFRSGAVAGMVTVGIGLVGATLILLLQPKIATTLLVGFGFGGSLAALFMRVGGGIFTKAADVGADLVGKVEAGIPEDDPRNPAVIADNVGDNVGDCAGMAADVFESYEVMLIAAIVLGAATASIFDAETWPRLVVFGLAVSGIGLLGSMIGIQLVQGSEDINFDPLKSIRKGFNISAGIAVVGSAALAFLTMGGTGTAVKTSRLIPALASATDEVKLIQAERNALAVSLKKAPKDVTPKELLDSPKLKALGFGKEDESWVKQAAALKPQNLPVAPKLEGYSKVTDFEDKDIPALQYAMRRQPDPKNPGDTRLFQTVGEEFGGTGDGAYVLAKITSKGIRPPVPAQGFGQPTPGADVDTTQYVGPIKLKALNDGLKQQASVEPAGSTVKTNVAETYPVGLYANKRGDLALAVENFPGRPTLLLRSGAQVPYYKTSVAELEALVKNRTATPESAPETAQMEIGSVESKTVPWWGFALAITFGVILAFIIERLTDHYVSTTKKPTQEVAGVATAGPAPMIIAGFAHAQVSSAMMVLVIVGALMVPLFIFPPVLYGGYTLSFYGIALVGLGLLTATGYILAMDTFGPISDNAQGVFEMSGAGHTNPEGARRVGLLDAAGNTTKALTKGFAIATAVVASVALFHSYLEGAQLNEIGLRLDIPEIFLGLLIGGAAPYLFSAMAINAVGRSAFELINEVRRQFRDDKGIMLGTSKPDYARCVAIVTAAAQRELLAPGILAIFLPIAVGFGFSIGKPPIEVNGQLFNLTGAEALGGFLAGAILSGQLMAVMLSNAGGMWDNAKKLIEDGMHGGKGTDAHKASVVGDTVGDPFKDTAGPALNPLIKVMNLVALLMAGVVVQPFSNVVLAAITLSALALIIGSMVIGRKGSMSDALIAAHAEPAAAGPAPMEVTAGSESPAPVAKPSAKKKLFVEEPDDQG